MRRSILKCASLLAIFAALVAGCQRRPLPEASSQAARFYVQRCGVCHAAYDPRAMTAAMWDAQVTAMEPRMAAQGTPLSADDRKTILEYLTRNAGQ
ncbi:MAG: hypothetical protein IVW54_19390 [Candidatus Binataceae bacterium]|nr:hypothetical protein [Candidatus Binataceae bacterium]